MVMNRESEQCTHAIPVEDDYFYLYTDSMESTISHLAYYDRSEGSVFPIWDATRRN